MYLHVYVPYLLLSLYPFAVPKPELNHSIGVGGGGGSGVWGGDISLHVENKF